MAASIRSRNFSECSEESVANDGELLQEFGMLEAIYINELNVVRNESGTPCELSVVLHPATAGNVDQQYVCLTLSLRLPEQYPNSLPEIAIRNSRGISDEHLASLDARLKQLATERQGGAMLYELIEVAKESLTNNNTPSCQCVICLYGFTEADVFTKTQCYHYFHSQCLARYIRHAQENEEESVCAVCREPVDCDLAQLDNAPPPSAVQGVFRPGKAVRDMQRRMARLYRRQQERGGIIDIEAENNKYLINISQTPDLPRNARISPVKSQSQTRPTTNSQNNTKSERLSSREEGITGAEPTNSSEKKDAVGFNEKQTEQPRQTNRSDAKQGGRVWGRGRGSRGRGHRRPYSSGAHDNYSHASGSDRRQEVKGQSSKEGSVRHRDGEKPASQSRPKTHNGNVVNQSREGRQSRDRETGLDGALNEGRRPGAGGRQKQPPAQRPTSHAETKLGRNPQETLPKLDKESVGGQKSRETKQEKRAKGKTADETDKAASDFTATISDADKKRATQDEDGSKRRHRGQRNEPDSKANYEGRPAIQKNIHKTEGHNMSSESKTNRRNELRHSDGSAKGDSSVHRDEGVDGRAARSGTGANQDGGKQRQGHRHRRREGEPGQSQDACRSNAKVRGRGEMSKVGPEESDGGRPAAPVARGRDPAKSSHSNPPESWPRSYRSQPVRQAPPGFGRAVAGSEAGGGQKTVRPPPGFENAAL